MTLNQQHLQWAASPSEENLNTLLAGVRNKAYKQAAHKLGSQADDIAQDTLLYVYQHIGDYDPSKAAFGTWIHKITEGILNDALKVMYTKPSVAIPAEYESLSEEPCDPSEFTRLADAFKDETELLALLLAGNSLVDCEQKLGITRKALRYRLAKIKRNIVKPTGAISAT